MPVARDAHVAKAAAFPSQPERIPRLAKINYAFEKRQRELAKKKQQDAKQSRKRSAREGDQPVEPSERMPSGSPRMP